MSTDKPVSGPGQRLLKFARSLPVRIVAGLYVAYLLAGFFLVNPLAQKLLPWVGERMLASRLTAERVAFNPFTLELRVHELTLSDQHGGFLAGFDRLYVNLGVSGVARWATRIQAIELDRPHVHLELRRGGGTNWDALAAKLREGSGPASQTIARLLIDHIQVSDGDISYVDADRPGEPFRVSLQPLNVALEELSTLPEDRGDYQLTARLPEQGATLRWKGEVGLNPLVSDGDVSLEGVRVGQLAGAFAGRLEAEASGTLGAQLHYRFAMLRTPDGQDVPSLRLSRAQVELKDFALAPRGGRAPLLQLPDARITDASFDSLRREIAVGGLRLEGAKVAATRDGRGRLDWQALFAPPPAGTVAAPSAGRADAAAPWKVAVKEIRLVGASARWTDLGYERPLRAATDGLALKASLSGEIGATTSLVLGPVDAQAGPVQLHSGDERVATLRQAALADARVQWPDNRIRIAALTLSGARSTIALDRRGRLNWAQILRRTGPPAPAAPGNGAGAAPDLEVGRIDVDDLGLRLVDEGPPKPVQLDLADGRITLANVGLDLDRPIPVQASFSVKQGGRFEARGRVVPGAPSGRLDLRLAGLSLEPFAPYVNRFARLRLHSGTAGTRGQLAFAPAKGALGVRYTGGFSVDDLAIAEEDTGEAFLGWKKLSSDNLTVSLAPDRLHIGTLRAQAPFGKVVIFEDKSLNLQRILRASPAPAAAASPAPAAAKAPGTDTPFPIAIDRLRIEKAQAQFADLSLTPQFGTRMRDLGGVVTGLSTDPTASAQVELDGKVDDYGSVRVRGSIQPFRATEATDLTLAFRNLEMTRLTPYSAKFAGRKIESGRLSVDLGYKIKDRELTGTNKFVVHQLKLGERVDSPDALKLPLNLAIAVLQDSHGVIDLDLPVSGNLDDPHFSYGAIVWKAIVNVLTKIVTAPFRALGALLGVDAQKMEAVGFDPGRSALLPPEQEKLKTLAEALAKRPALTLTIEPGYDPEADRRALQEAAMRRQAAEVAGLKLGAGEEPGPVDLNNHKVQTWLEDRYAAQAGKDAYRKLRASYQPKDASAAARVLDSQLLTRLGRQFGTRDSGPPSAFHAELLERLTRELPVPDEALVALARSRARALREAIVAQGLDAARVSIGAPAPHAAKDQQVACGLTLGAGAAGAPASAPAAGG
ncbi:MAG: hypothetical protein ABT20_02470 [Rubrivivax sp. SCN 70-15]|nr:MAG: hypothetical protein ABT20_02470 [Rubrivivax sp. SCN 70-15]